MDFSLERWIGKVAVITGASSGIGAAIAERLVEEGLLVVGLARRKEAIEEISKKLIEKKGKLYAFRTDITKEEDIINAFKWTTENVGPISILINNSGLLHLDSIATGKTEYWKEIFDVNVLGLCITTREAIQIMRENNIDGQIINIGSILGYKVIPGVSVYAASKYAVRALSETLRLELNSLKSKIKISSVSPGAVDTPIIASDGIGENRTVMLNPSDIADSIVYILSTPPHVQIQELIIKPVGEPI